MRMVSGGWLQRCREFAAASGVASHCVQALEAFGGRGGDGGGGRGGDGGARFTSFEQVLAEAEEVLRVRGASLPELLSAEVDRDQAEMFARRLAALCCVLDDLGKRTAEGRILKAGLGMRIEEILGGANQGLAGSALRVRAIIDYYHSTASVCLHRATAAAEGNRASRPSFGDLLQSIRWQRVERGLFRCGIETLTDAGPVRVSLLRFDRGRFRFRCTSVAEEMQRAKAEARTAPAGLARGLRVKRRQAAAAAPDPSGGLAALARKHHAVAALSGGYFLYSEPDIELPSRRFDPVGLLVREGEVLSPPAYLRSAFIQDEELRTHIVRVGMKSVSIHWGSGRSIRVGAVNSPDALASGVPTVFTRASGLPAVAHAGCSVTLVARTVACVQRGPAPIPAGGFVLALPPDPEWEELAEDLKSAGEVRYALPPLPGVGSVVDAMGAGPLLVVQGKVAVDLEAEEFVGSAPPMTFSQDETGDRNLLPRMAVGLTEEHAVVIAAVDGRNMERALGLTLHQTARVMKAAGCLSAMNLDGGSSKRLLLGDEVLDLPTTELVAGPDPSLRSRAVHTAVLVCRAGGDASATRAS